MTFASVTSAIYARTIMPDIKPDAVRLKTVYVLRVRPDDSLPWSEPEYYQTRKERDRVAAMNRVLGGIRTHSYNEKKTFEEVNQLFGD